ncbi:MAG: nicotinamide mononucleotide transporter, partial [Clostridia bacterium]|nr:nicotinamide mononucleotide transporter [Clostridia bacterium]
MGKLFEDWKIKEFVFLGISLIAIIFCFVFSPDKSVLSLITSIFGVTVVFLIAKGFAFAPIIEIVYDLLYCAVSIILGYYGEAIICVFIMIPIAIFSIISWFKNKNGTTVKINQVSKKEWLWVLL